MTLRPYQSAAVDAALVALADKGSAVLQMPTGAGKTKTATAIIEREDGPTWFICHRQEIERQASAAFTAAGIDHGIVSPRASPDYGKRVQIVSVATLARRMADLPAPKLAVWDECHHVAAKSWAKVREAMADTRHLGLTATPERLDGKGLSEWFSEIVTGPTTRELIDAGWLSEFRYFAPSDPDLTAAKVQAGDYKKGDIAKVMNTPVLIGDAVAEYKRSAPGRRALAFCASIDASKALVARFNADGIPAAHVDGTTPTDERDAAVSALAAGTISVLSNVEVFTEGFDLPAIDTVILMRPTKSLALFLQMIGRVLRLAAGKDGALIFDHAGLWLDHGWFDIPVDWSLDGGARKRRISKMGDSRLRRCPECKEVRVERVETCGCGYEFPTGREIGEYDGALREVRGPLPNGVVTRAEFQDKFGISKGCLFYQISKGLPIDDAGNIPLQRAIEWLQKNPPVGIPPLFLENPHEYENLASFERRVGRSDLAYIHGGTLPRASNGWVHIPSALRWIEENENKSRKIKGVVDGVASKAEFAKIVGISNGGALSSMIKRGLPVCHGGIPLDAGIEWIRAQNSNRRPPLDVKDPANYESAKSFSIRLSIDPHRIPALAERGLPCASNGWVHIQRGLEWVRDNTNIEIPPEAWPQANDNNKTADDKAA